MMGRPARRCDTRRWLCILLALAAILQHTLSFPVLLGSNGSVTLETALGGDLVFSTEGVLPTLCLACAC